MDFFQEHRQALLGFLGLVLTVALAVALALSFRHHDSRDSSLGLQMDFYRETCPNATSIIRSRMARILNQNKNATAQLLRLVFHDCFIQGCDASVLLDNSSGNNNQSTEKDAIPNSTLKGFDYIDTIKEELEGTCPGIVSCSDILVVSTRDSILLAGGPFYPLLTGRRDSTKSYYATAMAEIKTEELRSGILVLVEYPCHSRADDACRVWASLSVEIHLEAEATVS